MLRKNEYWQAIQRVLGVSKLTEFVLLSLTAAVIPLAEGILSATWTATPRNALAGWVLLCTVILHVLLLLLLFAFEAAVPASVVTHAADQADELQSAKRELSRRTDAYKLARRVFDVLNESKCDLMQPEVSEGQMNLNYVAGLKKLTDILKINASRILGVSSSQFSIHVWLLNGFRHIDDFPTGQGDKLIPELSDGELGHELSPVAITNAHHVAVHCFNARDGFEQAVSDNPQLFGSPTECESLPFCRFVSAHICRPCLPDHVGIILVTAKQTERFAEDAVDTLKFFAGAITNYTNAFLECAERARPPLAASCWVVSITGAGALDGNHTVGESIHEYEGIPLRLILTDGTWRITDTDGKLLFEKDASDDTGDPRGQYRPTKDMPSSAAAVID
ncbi:MAG: hypothetical protein ABSB74_11590 [Tepidisphaeraceae bacterium]